MSVRFAKPGVCAHEFAALCIGAGPRLPCTQFSGRGANRAGQIHCPEPGLDDEDDPLEQAAASETAKAIDAAEIRRTLHSLTTELPPGVRHHLFVVSLHRGAVHASVAFRPKRDNALPPEGAG